MELEERSGRGVWLCVCYWDVPILLLNLLHQTRLVCRNVCGLHRISLLPIQFSAYVAFTSSHPREAAFTLQQEGAPRVH